MRFLETPIFSEAIENLLDHERYRALQEALILRPDEGAVIPKSGGLRKIWWALAGRGKRGGCRIIYYWDGPTETFYMLYAYSKNEAENITIGQLRILNRLVQEEFR